MILEFLTLIALDVDGVKNPSLGIIISLLNYMVLPLMFVILATTTFRNKYNGGYITFSETLRIGAATTVIAALVFSVFNLVYNYMFPEFIDQTIDKMRDISINMRETALAQGASVEEVNSLETIEAQLVITRNSMKSFFSIPMTIVIYAVIGIVCAILIGAFVKKDKPEMA